MNKEILYHSKKIFYHTIGSGKPVMLIHGFGEDGKSPPIPIAIGTRREGLTSAQGQLIENSSISDNSYNLMLWKFLSTNKNE